MGGAPATDYQVERQQAEANAKHRHQKRRGRLVLGKVNGNLENARPKACNDRGNQDAEKYDEQERAQGGL